VNHGAKIRKDVHILSFWADFAETGSKFAYSGKPFYPKNLSLSQKGARFNAFLPKIEQNHFI